MQAMKLRITRPKIEGGLKAARTEMIGLPRPPMTVEQMRRLVEAERVLLELTGLQVCLLASDE